MIAAVVLFSVLAVFIACAYPEWIWTFLIGSSLTLQLLALQAGGAIFLGTIQLRATDPALLGIIVGTIYFLHKSDLSVFRGKPLAASSLLILCYFMIKAAWTLIFGREQLEANQVVSHGLGGLVAVFGELRDSQSAFLLPLYAYVAPRSRDLRRVGLPLVVGCLLILLRGAIFIGITGQIWSSNAEFRYFAAEDAVGLTVLCFILLFLKVPKLPFLWTRALACFGLITATVANHRSQWVALAAGGGVLILGILMGRPFFGERKGNRLIFSSVLLLFVATAAIASALQSYIASNPLLSAITVRLYAITDPKRDADASWRQAIWHDRIQQVGNNWPWGRLLGDRRMTLFAGKWWAVPDHSAYVSMYEIGGVILCCLIGLFWIMALLEAVRFLRVARTPEEIWPPMVAMTIVACSLAFGSGYDFPVLAPTMSVLLLLHAQQRLRSRSLMRTNSRRIIGKAVRP